MCGTLRAPTLSARHLPRIPLRFAHRNTRLRMVWCALRTIILHHHNFQNLNYSSSIHGHSCTFVLKTSPPPRTQKYGAQASRLHQQLASPLTGYAGVSPASNRSISSEAYLFNPLPSLLSQRFVRARAPALPGDYAAVAMQTRRLLPIPLPALPMMPSNVYCLLFNV